jgi:hypothetical protein
MAPEQEIAKGISTPGHPLVKACQDECLKVTLERILQKIGPPAEVRKKEDAT